MSRRDAVFVASSSCQFQAEAELAAKFGGHALSFVGRKATVLTGWDQPGCGEWEKLDLLTPLDVVKPGYSCGASFKGQPAEIPNEGFQTQALWGNGIQPIRQCSN